MLETCGKVGSSDVTRRSLLGSLLILSSPVGENAVVVEGNATGVRGENQPAARGLKAAGRAEADPRLKHILQPVELVGLLPRQSVVRGRSHIKAPVPSREGHPYLPGGLVLNDCNVPSHVVFTVTSRDHECDIRVPGGSPIKGALRQHNTTSNERARWVRRREKR